MCLGGRTGLLLRQVIVRPVKSPSSSESGGISSFSSISLHSVSRQPERILQNVSSASCKRLSKSLRAPYIPFVVCKIRSERRANVNKRLIWTILLISPGSCRACWVENWGELAPVPVIKTRARKKWRRFVFNCSLGRPTGKNNLLFLY